MSTSTRPAGKTGIMAALMMGLFLSPLNVSFTSVALPTLRDYFAVSVEQVAWVGTAYFIPMVVMMPLLANLGERWGLRRMYVLGLALLTVGSFGAVVAPSFELLLASRVVQGIGWSGLYPLALILIREHFPAGQRGETMGTWESAAGIAAIIAPASGGALVEFIGWRMVYATLGTVAVLAAALTIFSVPQRSERVPQAELPAFDWAGALSLTVTMLLALLGVARRSAYLVLAAVITAVVWWWLARRTKHPFVDPVIFGNRRFVSASMGATLRMLIAVAVLMSLPLFLEDVQELSPALVGLVLPAYSLFLFLCARPGGRWADRVGGRLPSVTGFVLMTVGVAMLLLLDTRVSVILIASAMAIRGIGAGISQAPFTQVATSAVGEELAAMTAGMYSMLRYSGLALGSALMGIVLSSRLEFYGSDGSGIDALPAFHELFGLLALLGVLGVITAWLIGARQSTVHTGSLAEVTHG